MSDCSGHSEFYDRRALLIVGPPGSGKTQRAREEARKIGCPYAVISFEELVGKFRPWLACEPALKAVIVEELPEKLSNAHISTIKGMLVARQIAYELKGEDPALVDAPRFIFTSYKDLNYRPAWGNRELFHVIPLGQGGPGRGQGRKLGTKLVTDPKTERSTQRYTKTDMNLIKSFAGDDVGTFIHDAAVDRARQFAEQAPSYDHIRDYIEDDEMRVSE